MPTHESNIKSPGESDSVLRPHQAEVFDKTIEYIDQGGNSGYIEMPTGTGKTVLFVELCRAINETHKSDPERAGKSILVVVPKINLMKQTTGRQVPGKGFAEFAPELKISELYGRTQQDDEMDGDVIVTTYQSLKKLFNPVLNTDVEDLVALRIKSFIPDKDAESDEPNEADIRTKAIADIERWKRRSIGNVSTIIFDEAHHLTSGSRRHLFDSIPRDIAKIGLTATPENTTGSIDDIFDTKIAELSLSEAIEMQLLSPVELISVRTDAHIEDPALLGIDYTVETLEKLASLVDRNRRAVDFAVEFVTAGMQGIASCVPRENLSHARQMSELLNARVITDSQGQNRTIRAQWVGHLRTPKQNLEILQEFEEGKIDILTFTDIIGEGWDSDKAKFILNLRPTRSMKVAKQRMGRVLRPTTPPSLSYVVDFVDDFDGLPPITGYDVLDVPMDVQAKIVSSSRELDGLADLPVKVASELISATELPLASYRELVHLFDQYKKVGRVGTRGVVRLENKETYYTPEAIQDRYHVSQEMLRILMRDYPEEFQPIQFAGKDRIQTAFTAYILDKAIAGKARFPVSRGGFAKLAGRDYAVRDKLFEVADRLNLPSDQVAKILREQYDDVAVVASNLKTTSEGAFVEVFDIKCVLLAVRDNQKDN